MDTRTDTVVPAIGLIPFTGQADAVIIIDTRRKFTDRVLCV